MPDMPVPESVKEILRDDLTEQGIEQWWQGYLRLDPHGQEGHAREHARRFLEQLQVGQGGA